MVDLNMAPDTISPAAVLNRFYDAERRFMAAGGKAGGASFSELTETVHPNVILHQTPDLPWGGDHHGLDGFANWAAMMSETFDMVDVQDPTVLEDGDRRAVVIFELKTRARKTGEVMVTPMMQVVTIEEGKIKEFRPYYWHVPDFVAAYRGELSSRAKKE